jgi:voltage-gated potassium channel
MLLSRLKLTLLALSGVTVAGTLGYMLIEKWPPLDSLYMTIITLTTVGFGEIRELSEAGRLFTIFLILFGIGTVGYGVGNLAAFLIEGRLQDLFRERRMERDIENLEDHIILCGYGQNGAHAGEELRRSGILFLVIEKDTEKVERLREEGLLVLQGDATEDETLRKAGIERAYGLITALPQDADNVYVTLTARGFNPDLTIVAMATSESAERKLLRAGANRVISPSEIGGRRMASVLIRPEVVNFLDVMMHGDDLELRLEEVRIQEGSHIVGKSIRDCRIREHTGALVIAYRPRGKPLVVNPAAETVLQPGDVLIVMGKEGQIEYLREIVGER